MKNLYLKLITTLFLLGSDEISHCASKELIVDLYGLVIVVVKLDVIRTDFDLYGFWDLILINFLVGLIIWEIFYQINTVINNRVLTTK